MAAASYYSSNQQGSNAQLGQQTSYNSGHPNIGNPSLAPQSHFYNGSSDHGAEEPPSQPVEPLLNKPPAKHGVYTGQQAAQNLNMIDPSTNRLRQRSFQRWKQILRVGQLLTKSITILFSTIMFGIMVFITIKYQSTKDEIRGGRTAWPKHPKLWPTFMLLAASAITLGLSFVTLLLYCCNFSRARGSWKITIMKYVIHIGAWICISIIYRYEKSLHGNNNDLWGWTCSEEVAALQSEFTGVVKFSSLCNSQVRLSIS